MPCSELCSLQFLLTSSTLHLQGKDLGYIYTNIGVSVGLGHLFLTRSLSQYFSPEKSLKSSLLLLFPLLVAFVFITQLWHAHVLTFVIMLCCSVGYTNAMAVVSNRALASEQGAVMGLAVAIQSLSECLPALIAGFAASLSQSVPVVIAALAALIGFCFEWVKSKKVCPILAEGTELDDGSSTLLSTPNMLARSTNFS